MGIYLVIYTRMKRRKNNTRRKRRGKKKLRRNKLDANPDTFVWERKMWCYGMFLFVCFVVLVCNNPMFSMRTVALLLTVLVSFWPGRINCRARLLSLPYSPAPQNDVSHRASRTYVLLYACCVVHSALFITVRVHATDRYEIILWNILRWEIHFAEITAIKRCVWEPIRMAGDDANDTFFRLQ